MPINQPSNQIKLTNVSLVRMKKGTDSVAGNTKSMYANTL